LKHLASCKRYDFHMKTEELKELQAPLKAKYRETPDAAVITLKADGKLGEGITCNVQTGKALTAAGLHPATGGNGMSACSGDMLLEALVACAGVTLGAVATAIGVDVKKGSVHAERAAEVEVSRPSACASTSTRPHRKSSSPRS
jgi:hypothetical protein